MSEPRTEPAGAGAERKDLDEVPFLIYFDDADVKPQVVIGEAGARATFKRISDQWNAHLFVKIESNTRDDSFASKNARLDMALPSAGLDSGLKAFLEAFRATFPPEVVAAMLKGRPTIEAEVALKNEDGTPTAWVSACPYCLRELHIVTAASPQVSEPAEGTEGRDEPWEGSSGQHASEPSNVSKPSEGA